MHAVCPSFESAFILSQHALFAFSAGALCAGADGTGWVAVWAHDITVRAKMRAMILNFIGVYLQCRLAGL